MVDLKALSDEDLDVLRVGVLVEIERRQAVESAPAQVAALTERFLAATAVDDPDTPPTWDSLGGVWPAGTLLADGGKTWRNVTLVPLTTPPSGFPGGTAAWSHIFVQVSDDSDSDSGGPQPWVQPGSTNPYPIDAVVTHNGRTWKNTHPANVWEPGVAEWTEIG